LIHISNFQVISVFICIKCIAFNTLEEQMFIDQHDFWYMLLSTKSFQCSFVYQMYCFSIHYYTSKNKCSLINMTFDTCYYHPSHFSVHLYQMYSFQYIAIHWRTNVYQSSWLLIHINIIYIISVFKWINSITFVQMNHFLCHIQWSNDTFVYYCILDNLFFITQHDTLLIEVLFSILRSQITSMIALSPYNSI
jgi:hypothetical protein